MNRTNVLIDWYNNYRSEFQERLLGQHGEAARFWSSIRRMDPRFRGYTAAKMRDLRGGIALRMISI